MESLFTQALGLAPPWSVASVDFKPAEGRIDFTVDCTAQRMRCPECGAQEQPVHDRLERTWRHLNFFQYKAFLHAQMPRVRCSSCGKTRQVDAPWSRPGSGFTILMEAFIVALCREMPMAAVARLLGISGDRVGRVLDYHVERARAKETYADVTQLGVDERSVRRGQRYVTLFHDASERRVLFGVSGRKADTFAAFAKDLTAHGGDPTAVATVSMDMSKAYQAGARAHCPNAKLCFDPFHVVALAHDALEQVRRAETKCEPDLKGSRWALLKDAGNWNLRQITLMHYLQRSTLKTARAWRLKEALRAVFAKVHAPAQAEVDLKAWISWARRSRLAPFKRLGKSLRDHLDGILEHFRTGLSNGFVEAMNGLLKAAIARARGYGTDRRFITMAYLIGGKLKHLPANPWTALSVQTAK
ncbi:MAG TPA: ISL3 family transposase [Oleiagrimonas sp.]|jgi:transposase|nr:ISL3 family transposase [Oleiagrimonas sp.]